MMQMSEQINELAEALAKAQGEIENASKSASNLHFRSKYADLAEVLNTCRPILASNALSVSQCPSYENGVVTVETILMHKSGQWIRSAISAPVDKQNAQGVGSAITYCRRYSLAAVVGIAQEDDDAESAIGRGKKPEQPKPEQRAKPDPAATVKAEADYKRIGLAIEAAKSKDELDRIFIEDAEAIEALPQKGKDIINATARKKMEGFNG